MLFALLLANDYLFLKFKVGLTTAMLHLTIATKFYGYICCCTESYTNYYFVYTDVVTSVQDSSFLLMCTHEKKKIIDVSGIY